jgi:glycerol-3-phosphate dehydrogenase
MRHPPTRAKALMELDEHFDLVVIGGGVNGLAVAWQAALSGVRTLVLDKGDWGSGTSSWSSRMIHGGLKYLERLDILLVRESLRDREWLLRNAPHLVKPLPFFLPFYKGDGHSKLKLRAGMILYDVLSFDKSVPNHGIFSRAQTLIEIPGLRSDGLTGSARYFDAQVEYSERLCIELMLAARNAGAVCINYLKAENVCVENSEVTGVLVEDVLTEKRYQIHTGTVVNLSGPWVDEVLKGTSAARTRYIGGTKGTHIVVDTFPGAPKESLYYESDDHRPMMVIPWLGRYLLGSTDVRFSGDLDDARASQEDFEYILYETNKIFPGADLTTANILYSYTGVRPLPAIDGENTADISRRHTIVNHGPEIEGLYSVIGGKLTTFRALSKHVLNNLEKRLGMSVESLDNRKLPGTTTGALTSSTYLTRLDKIYGARASELESFIKSEKKRERILDSASGLTLGEVLFSLYQEEAQTATDIICRRTMLGFEDDLGERVFDQILKIMSVELDWDHTRIEAERDAFNFYKERSTTIDQDYGIPTRD